MAGRRDFHRNLDNLGNPDPVARLKAIRQMGDTLRGELDLALFAAELAQVRQARSIRPQPSWKEIGRAIGTTGQYAQRRYQNAL